MSLLALISFTVPAQTDSISKFPGCYLSLDAGVGIPKMTFKSTAYEGMGGFALQGWHNDLTLDKYIPHKRIAMTFKLGYNTNAFNVDAYNSFIENNGYHPVNAYWSNSYKEISLLLGALYTIPIHKFSITLSLATGPAYLTIPNYKLTTVTNPNSTPEYFIFQSDTALPKSANDNFIMFLNGGLILRYSINRQISINLQGDFLYNFFAQESSYNNAIYTTYAYNSNGGPYIEISPNNHHYYLMPVSILNISIGVTFHLSKTSSK